MLVRVYALCSCFDRLELLVFPLAFIPGLLTCVSSTSYSFQKREPCV